MALFTAACVQLNSGSDMDVNLRAAAEGVRNAAAQGAQLIMLPEYAALLDGSGRVMREHSYPEAIHPALAAFQTLARQTQTWLLVGSITVKLEDERMANRSYLLSSGGTVVARYDKIHMFDVTLPSGKVIRESGAYRPGEHAVVAATPWGPLGMTVCYDLRFPQLYRALARAGAKFLAVPSSFQRETGVAHWHALLRSRAIENLSYVFAPAMCGEHPGNRMTYGHSLIIDPWGKILAELGTEPGVIVAAIDPDEVTRIRSMMPSLEHDREFAAP
ncbi:MAG TPA: carbon-nitrogen hydrolase family protein [Burkholderiales bacterium]|jgi:predicted amidohydrolase|nr:carbon-nitrogen hydrolase family protein [Burkholderiales bacterium]